MFKKVAAMLLACCAPASALRAQGPIYLVMISDDTPQRRNINTQIFGVCNTSQDTQIFRFVTPALGSTMVLVKGGGHFCDPGENPDLVLTSSTCDMTPGSYRGQYDCGYN